VGGCRGLRVRARVREQERDREMSVKGCAGGYPSEQEQSVFWLLPAADSELEGQLEHVEDDVAAVVVEYVLDGHSEHEPEPVPLLYLPGGWVSAFGF